MADDSKRLSKRIMVWVGSITVILTLVFGLQQLYSQLNHSIKASKEIETLLQASQVRLEVKDYPQAWKILSQADQYDVMKDEVESEKVNVAMHWLRDMRASEQSGTFTEQVKMVLPILDRVAIKSEGEYLADIFAHMGWADYLRQREGDFGLNPDRYYEKALAIDPDNTYANIMLSHWLLSNNRKRDPDKGWEYLQRATKSGNNLQYVRYMQFAALKNHDSNNILFLRLLDDMKRNGENIEDDIVAQVLRAHYLGVGFRRFSDSMRTGKPVNSSIALQDDLALIEWLWQEYTHLFERYLLYPPYIVAILMESTGDASTAHTMYKELQAGLPDNNPPMYKMERYMQSALDRTSTPHQ